MKPLRIEKQKLVNQLITNGNSICSVALISVYLCD